MTETLLNSNAPESTYGELVSLPTIKKPDKISAFSAIRNLLTEISQRIFLQYLSTSASLYSPFHIAKIFIVAAKTVTGFDRPNMIKTM